MPPFLCIKNKPQSEKDCGCFLYIKSEKEKSVYPEIYAFNVSDMIRTRDLLIRSQTLYPAELHSHIRFEQNIYYSMNDKMSITFFKKIKKFG